MAKIILTKRIYLKEKPFEQFEKVIVDTDKCEFSQGPANYTRVKVSGVEDFEVNEDIEKILDMIIKADEKTIDLISQNQNQIMDAMITIDKKLNSIASFLGKSFCVCDVRFKRN